MQKSVGVGIFFSFFLFFLLSTKGLLWPSFKSPCSKRTFSRHSHGTDHVLLFMSDDFTAFKFLLPFKLSAVCLGSEKVTASFALVHSVCGSLR